mmetsp:Transcript_62529/g.202685  ORF Transcript_62529/g.202685 Transcript_62529/m.202685 type:complete len:202 (-) Transcript_62529:768-1373(-)
MTRGRLRREDDEVRGGMKMPWAQVGEMAVCRLGSPGARRRSRRPRRRREFARRRSAADRWHRQGALERSRSDAPGRRGRGDAAARGHAWTSSAVEWCSACGQGRGQQLAEGLWRAGRARQGRRGDGHHHELQGGEVRRQHAAVGSMMTLSKFYEGAVGGPAAKHLKVLATEAGRTGQPAAEEAPLQLQGSERAELSERFGE